MDCPYFVGKDNQNEIYAFIFLVVDCPYFGGEDKDGIAECAVKSAIRFFCRDVLPEKDSEEISKVGKHGN